MALPFESRTLLSAKNSRRLVVFLAVFVAVILTHVPLSYGHVTYPNGKTACTAYVSGSSTAATYYFSKVRPWQVGLFLAHLSLLRYMLDKVKFT